MHSFLYAPHTQTRKMEASPQRPRESIARPSHPLSSPPAHPSPAREMATAVDGVGGKTAAVLPSAHAAQYSAESGQDGSRYRGAQLPSTSTRDQFDVSDLSDTSVLSLSLLRGDANRPDPHSVQPTSASAPGRGLVAHLESGFEMPMQHNSVLSHHDVPHVALPHDTREHGSERRAAHDDDDGQRVQPVADDGYNHYEQSEQNEQTAVSFRHLLSH